jgi:hypothetical protein
VASELGNERVSNERERMSREFRSLDATPRFISDRKCLDKSELFESTKVSAVHNDSVAGCAMESGETEFANGCICRSPFRRKEPVVEDISQECFELRVLCFDDLNG